MPKASSAFGSVAPSPGSDASTISSSIPPKCSEILRRARALGSSSPSIASMDATGCSRPTLRIENAAISAATASTVPAAARCHVCQRHPERARLCGGTGHGCLTARRGGTNARSASSALISMRSNKSRNKPLSPSPVTRIGQTVSSTCT